MSNKFLIVAAETKLDFRYFSHYKKIGVERGCLDLIKKQVDIDVAIADFDQVVDEEFSLIKGYAKQFLELKKDKDYLDGEEAIRKAQELGATEIVLVAKPSKRYDMNFSIMYLVERYHIKVMNEESIIFAIPPGDFTLPFSQYQGYSFISFFPIKKTILSLKDFRYSLDDYELQPHELRAYSNTFYAQKDGKVKTDQMIICILTK